MPLTYAGIDEAGYGPFYGPLTLGCAAFRVEEPPEGEVPDLWKLLKEAVAKEPKSAKGRIPINDSKALKAGDGCKLLEPAVLALCPAATLAELLDALAAPGTSNRADFTELPWYAGTTPLPRENDAGLLRIQAAQLRHAMEAAKVGCLGLRASVVYEDRYNQMLETTRNKASVSFTFVALHLTRLWQAFGREPLLVAVDRQGGRSRYRALLAQLFPEAELVVAEEGDTRSAYRLRQAERGGARAMTVVFSEKAEQKHLPVALASMTAKLCRELLMERWNHYFCAKLPGLAPSAGYGQDANRWRDEALPGLEKLGIDHACLRRRL